jgi:type II secretory pathway component PulK
MRRRGEAGFALVATLWFLALAALVAVVVEGWVAGALDQAQRLKSRTAAAAALNSAVERLAFTIVTGGSSARGLEPERRPPVRLQETAAPAPPAIALDGRPYRIGSVTVRLQDEGGLYDISNPEPASLERLLGGAGIPPSEAAAMIKRLAEYAKRPSPSPLFAGNDGDADYPRAGLPPPRHARLLTPWELYRVLGWQRGVLWRGPASLADLVTTGPVGGLDVNTAPVAVLAALTGGDAVAAARLVAARALRPVDDIADLLGPGSGLRPDIDRPLVATPSNIIRLHLTVAGEPLMRIVSIRANPAGTAPYRIDYVVDLPPDAAARALAHAAPPPELPLGAP